jgi:hypothetical protein
MPSPARPKLLDSRAPIRKQVERCVGKVYGWASTVTMGRPRQAKEPS